MNDTTSESFGKIVKGAVTGESAIKPEYVGNGWLVLVLKSCNECPGARKVYITLRKTRI